MTREIIEDFRFIVIPYMVNRLKEINYEGQGGSDAKEFMSNFNEICDMAIKALEQEPTTKNDHHKKNIQAYAHDFGVSEEQAEKELRVTTKNDLGVDCISRAEVTELLRQYYHSKSFTDEQKKVIYELSKDLQYFIHSVEATPQEPRKGKWLRMSDLSEQEDDRYKCSCCGNVVHYTNKINLYTFNNWCGRCGSDNGIHIHCEVEE